jgi:hypothetical protein
VILGISICYFVLYILFELLVIEFQVLKLWEMFIY